MRILCLAVLIADFPQLLKKFDSQIRQLRRYNADTLGFAIGPSNAKQARGYSFQYLSLPFNCADYMAAADSLAQGVRPGIIYFRYPGATRRLWQFTLRHPNVVFEHNAVEEAELTKQARINEIRWGSRVLAQAAGLCGVTDEILRYEQQRAGNDRPGLMLGNGIEPQSVPRLDFALQGDAIHMLCAAHFAPWHGVDRLLHGMAAYAGPQRFILHLAGIGESLPQYRELARRLNLEDQVRFHGRLDQVELSRLAATCHLGVGSLARHRTGMGEHAALKHREYCLQGLPFFFGGRDVDFDPLPEFALSVPQNDAPIDMAAVAALARLPEEQPGVRARMRSYGEERLSWRSKCNRLHEFLQNCAAQSDQTRSFTRLSGGSPQGKDALPRPDAISAVIALGEDCSGLEMTLQTLREQNPWQNVAPQLEVVFSGPRRLTEQAAALRKNMGDGVTTLVGTSEPVPHQSQSRPVDHWEAWNAGMKSARGPWLLPLLPGDRLDLDLLQALAFSVQSRPELNMLTAHAQDADGRAWLPQGLEGMVEEANAAAGCLLFRKSLWEDTGGYRRLHPLGLTDALFWLDCLGSGLLRRHLPRAGLVRALARSAQSPGIPENLKPDALAMLVTLSPAAFAPDDVLKAQSMLLQLEPAALPALQACLERHPDQAWPRFCLGLTHEGRGELADAVACQRVAANRDPEDWQPHLRLYLLHKALGLYPQAILDKKACLEREERLKKYFREEKRCIGSMRNGEGRASTRAR